MPGMIAVPTVANNEEEFIRKMLHTVIHKKTTKLKIEAGWYSQQELADEGYNKILVSKLPFILSV
jgi:hypothetical protein